MIRKKSVDVIHKNFLNFNKASKKIHKNSTKDFPSNKIFYLPHATLLVHNMGPTLARKIHG